MYRFLIERATVTELEAEILAEGTRILNGRGQTGGPEVEPGFGPIEKPSAATAEKPAKAEKKAEKKAAAPAAPAPEEKPKAPAAAAAPKIEFATVKAALTRMKDAQEAVKANTGMKLIKEVMAKFGAQASGDIQPSDFAAVIEMADEYTARIKNLGAAADEKADGDF